MSKNFNSIEFIRQKLQELDSLVDTRPSTALYDLFIKPQAYLSQPILDDSTTIANSQSVNNIDSMSEDSADALASNVFITRLSGDKALGNARFYFTEPTDVVIPQGTVVLSSDGLRFLSTGDVESTKEAMALNIEGGYYYITVPFEAEGYGLSYNTAVGEIISTEASIDGVVKVSNPQRFVGGLTRETNAQVKERIEEAISTRNLLSSRSVNTLLAQNFAQLKDWLVVGYYEPEMARDTVNAYIDGTVYTVHIGGQVDVYVQTSSFTDTEADTTAIINIPASRYRAISETGKTESTTLFTDVNANFLEAAIKSGDILRIISGTTAGVYTVNTITDATSLNTTEVIPGLDLSVAYEIYQSTHWNSPIIKLTQVDRLDPGTLTPSGIQLYDGRDALVSPKQAVPAGRDPECVVDSTDSVHCVYEYDNDVWYTKISNAGNVTVSPINISTSSMVARNPDISVDSTDNVVIVWEESDTLSSNYEIYLSLYNTDGTEVFSPTSLLSHSVYNYKDPVISVNQHGLSLAAIVADQTGIYTLIDTDDYITELLNVEFISGSTTLYTPSIDTDDDYAYIAIDEGATLILLYKINSVGYESFGGIDVSDGVSVNTLPSVRIDSSSNIYTAWGAANSTVAVVRMAFDGTIERSATTVLSFDNYAKAPRLYIDRSDKIHIATIEDIKNSGDVHYKKIDQDFNILVEDILVQDQYNNADYVAMAVDTDRRPHIIWDSYDPYVASLYYTKRQSQDYRVKSLEQNYRYSMKEIVNIEIDPYYSSDYLRFSYQYAHDVNDVDEYIAAADSLDRVFCAGYVVKYFVPAFVDVSMTYSGDDNNAADLIEAYINDSTSYAISVSDLLSALPLSISSRVSMPVTITVERHDIDGTIVSTTSTDYITEPRTSRFIARNVVVA